MGKLTVRSNVFDAYSQHVTRWHDCRECDLCESREKVVLARGQIPAEVLFIGEGPGESEDTIGFPFVGDAGKLLDKIITASLLHWKPVSRVVEERFCFSNIVACIPLKDDGLSSGALREPTKEEALACRPRLLQLIRLVNPRLIVMLGNPAKRFLPKELPKGINPRLLHLVHPSYILRTQGRHQNRAELNYKRCVIALSREFGRLYDPQTTQAP